MRAPRCILRVLLAAAALPGALAFGAALGDNTVKLAPSLLELPQNIRPLRYTGENRYSDRRMGRSFGYSASGISLALFVYDYGLHNLPDGPDSVTACEQFESASFDSNEGELAQYDAKFQRLRSVFAVLPLEFVERTLPTRAL